MTYDEWKTTDPDEVEPCRWCGATSHPPSRCPEMLAEAAEMKADQVRDDWMEQESANGTD